MNLLIDRLPTSVEIGGRRYALNTDYRYAVRAILAFEDDDLTDLEKQFILLANLYKRTPPDTEEALKKAAWFLDGGKDWKGENSTRVYSFSKDANLIFAAFRQTHGIDLETEKMHWWKFIALFMDLGQDTAFCNLTGLRKRNAEGKTTKEEREIIRAMGDMFVIPQPISTEQREAERIFEEYLKHGQSKDTSRT